MNWHAAIEERVATLDRLITKLRADIAAAEGTIAGADRATQAVQAKLNTELREHAKTKRTLADTRIHVDEIERLNERLLEDAKRLTAAMQRIEAVRDAGITRAAVEAELAGTHTIRRLAALRAEKKLRLRRDNGIESCEACGALVVVDDPDSPRKGVSCGDEGGYLCTDCACACREEGARG